MRVKLVRLVLDNGAWMFVAGSSKNMPSAVRRELVSALATRLGQEKAESYVERMELSGKYQTETWA